MVPKYSERRHRLNPLEINPVRDACHHRLIQLLQERMDQAHAIGRRLQRENEGLRVERPDFYGAVEEELGLGEEEAQRILDLLIRDGLAFRLTSGALGFRGWEVEP